MLDFTLAVGHHLLVFAIFGILAAEVVLVQRGMSLETVARIGRIDLCYGVFAAAVVVLGFCRAVFAARGWTYYSHNGFFWTKLAVFGAIALLSIAPTVQFVRWQRTQHAPSDAEVGRARTFLYVELALFALLPIAAAAMARGYGEF